MRILCIPGAYGSSDKFEVQLAPLVNELTKDGSATFHFIHGPCTAVPPKGFEEYFGKPPYFRFIEPDKDVDAGVTQQDDVLARIRDFPDCETPEDTMRELMRDGIATTHRSTDNALKFLVNIMEEQGPFDAIIGYSEGATVAATLLLHEQQRSKKKDIPPMFKYAIFFAGWPPVDPVHHNMILSDETDATIEIPTCHIIGSLDPYVHGSMALYNVCDPDTAYMFDHAKGHTLPRDKDTVRELGDVVREAITLYGIH
ncbi:serine hydrolase FSH [Chaetomium sp. MPI-SDFR-AT-0129]|uniref:Serine hydrolase FSH n=1 Tax=Dichotomopilus funicola TaxID=1934379 RepID=A0AAN6V678_9PEZI|nr:serine hydrolase FSH [Chaetomium sp. MPI-SDFR-AT-0129]KAK4145653.1 serine hydrolase FSH [Dichotomopilus funicola]